MRCSSTYAGAWSPGITWYGVEAISRSAFSVVMPDFTAASEYKASSVSEPSDALRPTSVEPRCTIVTSAPSCHNATQISCAELFEPMTTAFLPL